jgi:dihydroorotase
MEKINMHEKSCEDIVIKNGFVIDPYQGINEEMDISVSNGKIVEVRKGISASNAKMVVDASGLIVTPGLIDLHVHCSYKIIRLGVDPEFSCLAKGSTTVLDAGSIGELNFPSFRSYIIDRSRTSIFALLNIESLGMIELCGNQSWPEFVTDNDEKFINIDNTIDTFKRNSDILLGIKWAHHGLKGLRLARETADKLGCILMAENRHVPENLKYLKKGDIVTHIYHMNKQLGFLLNEDNKVREEYYEARKRGVIIDVGHGAGSFSWTVAEEAFKQDMKPDTISTDLHIMNVNGPVYDMPTTMSKFLLLGMPLYDVVKASTQTPAEVLGKIGEIGTLKPGARADIVVFKLEEGKFIFTDAYGNKRIGRQRLFPVKVIKNGEIVIY